STNQIAESLLNSGTTASANAEIQSNTGFTLTFTVTGGTANFSLNFDADPDLQAAIMNELGIGSSAQGNLQTTFTLTQNTGGTINATWSPQGTAATNDC